MVGTCRVGKGTAAAEAAVEHVGSVGLGEDVGVDGVAELGGESEQWRFQVLERAVVISMEGSMRRETRYLHNAMVFEDAVGHLCGLFAKFDGVTWGGWVSG